MKHFTQQLHFWYDQNYRELPWRTTTNPYLIWISEIILQQTRVNQGLAYYNRFIEKWPSMHELACASEQEVLKMWQGLGYYSRARNMLATAQSIMKTQNGVFPGSAAALMKLKGIGKYTAAAIASNAYNEKVAVVDGNVIRFVTRLLGIRFPADSPACRNEVQQFVDEHIDINKPGIFNQAMMEFGALCCTPQHPGCAYCPFSTHCFALKNDLVSLIPQKKNKIILKKRYFNYLIFLLQSKNQTSTYLNKRTENDIWKGLFQFPLIETENPSSLNDLCQHEAFAALVGEIPITLVSVSNQIKHQLTHQTIFANFFVINLQNKLNSNQMSLSLVSRENLGQYPLPRLIDRYLQQNGLPYIQY